MLVTNLGLLLVSQLCPIEGNVIIVPVAGMTTVVENSLKYAKGLSPDQIIAVYVSFEREDEKKFEEKWKKWQPEYKTGDATLSLQEYH